MLYRSLIIRAVFQRVNYRDPFWSDTVKLEPRSRSKRGVFYMWQKLEVLHLKVGDMDNRFVPIPLWWYCFVVATCFWDQMGPSPVYVES